MQITIVCPECGKSSLMDKGDGYHYIAKAGCPHNKAIWKKVNNTVKLSILQRRIKKARLDKDNLACLLEDLVDRERILIKEIEGKAG